ncbi:MAG: flagellar motor switch protein FliN [Leptospirales bacterium]|jgi:flagellar motor switch protein FliN/FliY
MVDGSLSQEEIDALLQGADDFSAPAAEAPSDLAGGALAQDMSPMERETVADILHQSMNAGTQGLGMILSRGIKLGQAYVESKDQAAVERDVQAMVGLTQSLSGGLTGVIGLYIPAPDAARIAAIVMGNEDTVNPDAGLDSAQSATIKESLGPMLFTMASQISARIGTPVTPMPVEIRAPGEAMPIREASILKVQIPFTVEGGIDSRMSLVLSLAMGAEINNKTRMQAQGGMGGGMDGGGGMMPQQPSGPQPGQAGIKDVSFPALHSSMSGPVQPNMNLLMDVQMTLTVELGRTKMYIKEILGLGEGSIIELEKLAGEPVDLLASGKLIAKGEVVVIDENFGVRVTDIVSPIDRLKNARPE